MSKYTDAVHAAAAETNGVFYNQHLADVISARLAGQLVSEEPPTHRAVYEGGKIVCMVEIPAEEREWMRDEAQRYNAACTEKAVQSFRSQTELDMWNAENSAAIGADTSETRAQTVKVSKARRDVWTALDWLILALSVAVVVLVGWMVLG